MSTATTSEPTRRPGALRRRLLVAVAVTAAAALAGVTSYQADRQGDLASARQDALEAATTRVPDLLGYEHSSLSEDLERALEQTTGEFTDDYRSVLDGVVEPTARKRRISTSASVSAAGVVPDQDAPDRVVVLVFLTQSTSAKGSAPTVTGSRVEVTMEKSGDQWKIAGLEPL